MGPDCKVLDMDISGVSVFRALSSCDTTNAVFNYTFTDIDKTIADEINITWSCGFYGNSSSMTLDAESLLTDHYGYRETLSGHDLELSWKLSNAVTIVNITLYSPSRDLLLRLDWQTGAVTSYSNRVEYIKDAFSFKVRLKGVEAADNGTYTCVYDDTASSIQRLGLTVVVLGIPKTPLIRLLEPEWSSDASSKTLSGTALCTSASGSAAPLYYTPVLNYTWLTPHELDKSGIETSNSTYKNGLDIKVHCDVASVLPVYCSVAEMTLSAGSAPWDPRTSCDNAFPASMDTVVGVASRSAIIFGIVSTTCLVFAVVISCVVGRRRVKRCSRKSFKQCGKAAGCCERCLSSGSDSDSDQDFGLSRRQRMRNEVIFGHPSVNAGRDGLALADGIPRQEVDRTLPDALEQIAIDESRQAARNRPPPPPPRRGSTTNSTSIDTLDSSTLPDYLNMNDDVMSGQAVGGAVGGVESQRTYEQSLTLLTEVEELLEHHNSHLDRNTIALDICRDTIITDLLHRYAEESVAKTRIIVHMVGEAGLDGGGVALDMFTTFWNRAREQFFIGTDAVIPHLPAHRYAEDTKYRTLGRILSHTVAVTKEIPIPMCKSAFIGMIYNTSEVGEETVIEDFLAYLDVQDRDLVQCALDDFDSLSEDRASDLTNLFLRFEFGKVPRRETFRTNLILMAKHVILIRPRPLLEMMRSGLPDSHIEYFWSRLHLDSLTILFQALKPTPERIINRLHTCKDYEDLSRNQRRVFQYLKDFVKEMDDVQLENFLQFITGKKSTPREGLLVEFIREGGKLRLPKAHTCSNLLEVPDTYEDYATFKTEFKTLLESSEAFTLNME